MELRAFKASTSFSFLTSGGLAVTFSGSPLLLDPRRTATFHGNPMVGSFIPESSQASARICAIRQHLLVCVTIETLESSAKLCSCFRHRKQLFLQRRDISIADFLRVRILTRSIMEKFFETTKFVYHVIDVNGARFGRKQWPHTWEGANCLFFVASLAGYNRCLIQHTDTVRLVT